MDYLFIYWEVYKDSNEIRELAIENIYLSVIKILERVSSLYTYNAQFQIGNTTFKNEEKYRGYKLPTLDNGFLNYIEHTCSEIPNQEETNQLWENYQKL